MAGTAPTTHGPARTAVPTTHSIFVGLDVGYREHVAAACPLATFSPHPNPDGWKHVKTCHFASDATGFDHLQHYLDRLSTNHGDFLMLLEPTGGYYGLALLTYLLARDYPILQIENVALKAYREKIYGSDTKTDDSDARVMARMGFLHATVGEEFSIRPVHLTSADVSALRVMVRDLQKLSREITRRKNQLQQVVAVTFPELKTFFRKSTASRSACRLLEKYPTPGDLARAPLEDIRAVLHEARAYKHEKRASELHMLARTSAGLDSPVHHCWRQSWVIKQLPALEEAHRELVEHLRLAVADHPYTPIIESLPIKSTIWTATLIAVIGDVGRFRNYADFRAYMGWCPRIARSGTSVNSSRLGNQGVRPARNVLGQMTTVLIAPTVAATPFRDYYNRLVGRGMKPMTAKGHMAGKLAVVLYGMLKSMKRYDEEKHRKDLGFADNRPAEDRAAISAAEGTPPVSARGEALAEATCAHDAAGHSVGAAP